MNEAPLTGLRILDVSRALAGPFCTMLLGDMGATVIKVENPAGGDPSRSWGPPFVQGESTYFLSVNRNKQSITLDFHSTEGRSLLKQLAAKSDVFVENFRVGTLKRFGLDYETLRSLNRNLIYCCISGYGQTGPRKQEAGFDITLQAESGIMDLTGEPEGPPMKAGVSITDIVAGIYAVQGILLALLAREKTGTGQLVDVALYDCALSLLTFQASSTLIGGSKPRRMGNLHPSLAPYESFAASDGYFTVGIGTDEMWKRFSKALLPYGFESGSHFDTNEGRVKFREELHGRLQQIFEKHPLARWLAIFKEIDIPFGRVNSVNEALADEHTISREMVVDLLHTKLGALRQLGIPVKLSETPGSLQSPPPLLGEHNEQIYSGTLGLSESDIKSLRTRGVI